MASCLRPFKIRLIIRNQLTRINPNHASNYLSNFGNVRNIDRCSGWRLAGTLNNARHFVGIVSLVPADLYRDATASGVEHDFPGGRNRIIERVDEYRRIAGQRVAWHSDQCTADQIPCKVLLPVFVALV